MPNSTKRAVASPPSGILTTAKFPAFAPQLAPILPVATLINTLPDVPGGQPGLLSREELFTNGLTFSIPLWDNSAIVPTTIDRLVISINNTPLDPIDFEAPVSTNYTWPYVITIPEYSLGAGGLKNISYEVFYATAGSDTSMSSVQFTVARFDPNAGVSPDQVELPDWVVDNRLTAELLAAAGGELALTFEPPLDRNVGDRCRLYWDFFDALPIHQFDIAVTGPVTASVTEAQIVAAGRGRKYLTYDYVNRAGFVTPKANLYPLEVVLEPAPGPLADPRVPEAPLTLADAQTGKAEVYIDMYTNAQPGDTFAIEFNGRVFTSVLSKIAFPHIVEFPWEVLRDGGLEMPYTADLRYRVIRNGVPTAYSGSLSVDVDLTSAGGRPEDPGPVNPDLDPPELESFAGEINELVDPTNLGEPATVRFDVYTGAAQDHQIQVWWDGTPVFDPPHTVTAAEAGAAQFELSIPWAVIEAGKNGMKRVWYTLNNGVNDNLIDSVSIDVDVRVFTVENLRPITFPDSTALGPYRSISCAQAPYSGIRINIYDPVNLERNDEITIEWIVYGPDDYFSMTPVMATQGEFRITVMANHSTPGHPGEDLRVPFVPYIQPVTTGRIEVFYTATKADGATEGTSQITECLLTRRQGDGSTCDAP
jgi:hypothetical protein